MDLSLDWLNEEVPSVLTTYLDSGDWMNIDYLNTSTTSPLIISYDSSCDSSPGSTTTNTDYHAALSPVNSISSYINSIDCTPQASLSSPDDILRLDENCLSDIFPSTDVTIPDDEFSACVLNGNTSRVKWKGYSDPVSSLALTDDQLASMPINRLNRLMKNMTKERVESLKHRRRTLKNRQYAQECRKRKVNSSTTDRRSVQQMQKRIDFLETQLSSLRTDRDFYKSMYEAASSPCA